AGRGQDAAGHVDARARRVAGLRYEYRHREQGEHRRRYVHQEDRAPPVVVEQVPADQRPERDTESEAGGDTRDRLAPVLLVDHDRKYRDADRGDDRGPDPERRADRDQGGGRVYQRADQRTTGEEREPDDEQQLAPVPVAERPGRQQEPGEDQDV